MKLDFRIAVVLGLLLLVSGLLNIHQIGVHARTQADARLRTENDSLRLADVNRRIESTQSLADSLRNDYEALKKRYQAVTFKPTDIQGKTDAELAAIIRKQLGGK